MALLFDIRRFSVHDGPGIRTTLFFKGCPLACPWCHNPEGQKPEYECYTRSNVVGERVFHQEEIIGKQYSTDEMMREIIRDRPFYEESGGGVTFSGGEPFSQLEALLDLLQACKQENIHTAVDTSGFAEEEAFRNAMAYTDVFLFDLKHSDDKKHVELTGVSNVPIRRNLLNLLKESKKVIIRIPLIPGVNTDRDNLDATKKILMQIRKVLIRADLLPYHPLGIRKYESLNMMKKVYPELREEELNLWQHELQKDGIDTIIGG
jgi:pyruvate formate lyase activating enzyme